MSRIVRCIFRAATAVALTAAAANVGAAQGTAPACSCRQDLDSLASRIEQNYIGFRFEVAKSPRESAYRAFVKQLQDRAAATGETDCIFLLRELSGWFHDGHVFVIHAPQLSAAQTDSLAAAAERRPLTEEQLRTDLTARAGRLDPIEGIWFTPGYRLGVVRDGGMFVAVVLHADSSRWQPGQVKATFRRLPDGGYRAVLRANDHSRRDVDFVLYRNTLLAGGPYVWGRIFPLAPHEVGTLDSLDPEMPTLRLLGAEAVVVSVPSHDPSYHDALQALVDRNRDAIRARPILIIDIRGDQGGGSQTTAPLVPFLVSREMRPAIGPQGLSMVLSSSDNIRYFKQGGWNPDSVAERMAAATGRVIPLIRNEPLGMPFPNDTVMPRPARVAVLMDRGDASAAEAFLLQARRSTKVTLFGQNSAGMIDYQSVTIVRLACLPSGNLLGYPVIAASPTLPKDGLNATGIPPDVTIPAGTTDAVAWVLTYYAGRP